MVDGGAELKLQIVTVTGSPGLRGGLGFHVALITASVFRVSGSVMLFTGYTPASSVSPPTWNLTESNSSFRAGPIR